ncbi:phenylalanine--tRNA ligase subunit alpha [Schlesneria paludicola]|uniref:phenylalanine--tRNA ligase subunit alpha n=1 Tax=Schlesneria paludicola TaxID=360056 RepID=UPI00029A532D|nr:phenylalanine--tRNA ligase subunit alpha [Schlesneria paludicola]
MDLGQTFANFQNLAMTAIAAATNAAELEQVRIEFLGKKQGKLKDLQTVLGQVPAEQRPEVGKRFNEIKDVVTQAWEERQQLLNRPKVAATAIDLTLPGIRPATGKLHPLTQTINEFQEIMSRFGFEVEDGPEIEDEWHNFVALNIPDDHPARDPLDNFYLATAAVAGGGPRLLRSQTSTIQIRVMENRKPPVRIVSIGRVYRPDEIDDTHHLMFHQMEGLMVGPDVTMASLKTVLRLFAAAYLGEDVHVRFRPSFFPFTEPSVEFDVQRGDGWLELGGAGMVDPNVLKAVGYNPDEVSGFAFGLGIARFCMMRHDIKNIRHFYSNDLRFLQQF